MLDNTFKENFSNLNYNYCRRSHHKSSKISSNLQNIFGSFVNFTILVLIIIRYKKFLTICGYTLKQVHKFFYYIYKHLEILSI